MIDFFFSSSMQAYVQRGKCYEFPEFSFFLLVEIFCVYQMILNTYSISFWGHGEFNFMHSTLMHVGYSKTNILLENEISPHFFYFFKLKEQLFL